MHNYAESRRKCNSTKAHHLAAGPPPLPRRTSTQSSHQVGVTTNSGGQLEFSLPWKISFCKKGRCIDAFVESPETAFM